MRDCPRGAHMAPEWVGKRVCRMVIPNMDPKRYLMERRAEVAQAVENITNFQVFDFNYVPDQPIERPEMDQLVRAIL